MTSACPLLPETTAVLVLVLVQVLVLVLVVDALFWSISVDPVSLARVFAVDALVMN